MTRTDDLDPYERMRLLEDFLKNAKDVSTMDHILDHFLENWVEGIAKISLEDALYRDLKKMYKEGKVIRVQKPMDPENLARMNGFIHPNNPSLDKALAKVRDRNPESTVSHIRLGEKPINDLVVSIRKKKGFEHIV